MAKRPTTIKNFAAALADFDRRHDTATPELVVPFPTGRAYKDKDGLPHFDTAHLEPQGESLCAHLIKQEAIAKLPAVRGGVYIGAAGMANYGYMAHSRASGAILFDINPLQRLLHEEIIKIIAANEMPEAAQEALLALPRKFAERVERALTKEQLAKFDIYKPEKLRQAARSYVVGHSTRESLEEDIAAILGIERKGYTGRRHPIMGLEDPKAYAHLHRLAKNNAIACVTLDIKDSTGWQKISEHIKSHDVQVSLTYLSNIFYFMGGQKFDFAGTPIVKGSLQKAWKNIHELNPAHTVYSLGGNHVLKMVAGQLPTARELAFQGCSL